MKKLSIIILMLSLACATYGQSESHYEITKLESARFEIIQSPMARKFTIKIDKETGETWELVADRDNKLSWQSLYKGYNDAPDTKKEGKNNYIIFMGGITAKDIYLLNVNTGACWQLVNDASKNENWWSTIKSY